MNAKHTPGPWFADLEPLHDGRVFVHTGTTHGTDRRDIADVLPWHGEANRQANARLISAAPELLEALEGFVALVENDHILAATGFRSYLIDALTKANEAVYKAKGEA